jgi:hypothetical protein
MTRDDDDLTPAQQGKTPEPETLARRARFAAGRERLLRPRSWLTLLVGLAAVAVAAWLLMAQ